MTDEKLSFHNVRINFNSTKRYRRFAFLPRVGDRINLTDDGTQFHMDVDSVWFDDHYGERDFEVNLNCTVKEESAV